MRLFDWADRKNTLLARILSRASLWLLSAAITLVLFTAFGTLYFMFVNALLG